MKSAKQLRFIVFQHGACEHPGIFRRFFKEDGIAWHVVELDRGAPIPTLDPYDAMAFVAALWFWYGIVGTITVRKPGGVEVLAQPIPLDMDPNKPVLGHLRQGERVDVYSLIYGKDYLVYKVRPNGVTGYVSHYGDDVRFESR